MDGTTRITSLADALSDAITRLGHGASAGETSAVRDGVTSLFYTQGFITAFQSSALVHVAVLTYERRNMK